MRAFAKRQEACAGLVNKCDRDFATITAAQLRPYSRTATASISIRKSLLARADTPIQVLVGRFSAGKKPSKA